MSLQKIGFILRLESWLLTQGTIRCCYISQTCWRGDLRCLAANCVSVYNWSCRIWTGCTVCCVILSDTFVYRGFFIPTLRVIHVIQLIFTESFHVANRRSHTEFTPFPQCPPPMFDCLFFLLAQHMFHHKRHGEETKTVYLNYTQVLVHFCLLSDPTGFVSTHSDGWKCSVTSVRIHWCFAISVTERTELQLLLFVFWNNFLDFFVQMQSFIGILVEENCNLHTFLSFRKEYISQKRIPVITQSEALALMLLRWCSWGYSECHPICVI